MQENSAGPTIYTNIIPVTTVCVTMSMPTSIMTYAIQPTSFPISSTQFLSIAQTTSSDPNQQVNLPNTSQINATHEMSVDQTNESFNTSWQVIKRRTTKRPNEEAGKSPPFAKKSVPSNNNYPDFVSTNSFAALNSSEELQSNDHEQNAYFGEESVDKSSNNDSNAKKIPKPPPIFIDDVVNFPVMINNIETVINADEFTCKTLSKNQVKINANSIETYRKLVKLLEQHKIAFHTYQLKQDKAYRVVVRNIHPTVSSDDIKEALKGLGFEIRNVMNIRSRINKEPLPLFFVDQEPNEENKKIYDIKYLLRTKISVEPPRKKYDIPQCLRCQAYGHTKSYCTKPFYCVKCAGDHPTTSCTKAKTTAATCALCNGPHPASYKGCPVYQDLQKPRSFPNNNRKITMANQGTEKVYTVRPNVNYAQATKSSAENTYLPDAEYTENNNNGHFLNQFLTKFESMFAQLMNQNNMIINLLTTMINKQNNG